MGAKFCGYEYLGTEESLITVKHNERLIKFKLLQILEFTSARKRMSVIIEDENGIIKLLTKGADSIIAKLLA